MDITCRREGPLTIVDMCGRLAIGPGEIEVIELQTIVSQLIAAGWLQVVFNLRRLDAIDARGLGEIAQSCKHLRKAGGELTLVAPTRVVRRMLTVTRLDTVIAGRDEDGPQRRPRADLRRVPSLARAERAPG
jgi:anti-anti-sigma factor